VSGDLRPTRRAHWGRRGREALLTAGAILGVLCLGWAIAMSVFGVTPLVFSSGSMAPEIATGDLAFARSVSATELRPGDVVSIEGESGTRVTHRIVEVERGGGRTVVTLKGDANASPDTDTHAVTQADRVFAHVPKAGYVVSAVAGPTGAFVGGVLVAVILLAAFWPGSARPRGGRRRAEIVAAGLVLVAVGASSHMPPAASTQASFTDAPKLSTGSLATHTVQPPDSTSCSASLLTATVQWPSKDPRYDYEAVLHRVSTGDVVSTRQITGSSVSTTYSGLTSFGLFVGAGTVDFQVEIRSKLATATTWESATVRSYGNLRVFALLFGATVSCTT
jgi:signal peptidase I